MLGKLAGQFGHRADPVAAAFGKQRRIGLPAPAAIGPRADLQPGFAVFLAIDIEMDDCIGFGLALELQLAFVGDVVVAQRIAVAAIAGIGQVWQCRTGRQQADGIAAADKHRIGTGSGVWVEELGGIGHQKLALLEEKPGRCAGSACAGRAGAGIRKHEGD